MFSSRFSNVLAASALATLIFAGGCFQQRRSPTEISAQSQSRENARILIAQLEPEMSLEEVKALWFDKVYPWKSETRFVTYGDDPIGIMIQWYYTDLVKNDGRVTENELTPVVFNDQQQLLGWGRDFLPQFYEYVEKQEEAQKD
jgi:hypothetical protein